MGFRELSKRIFLYSLIGAGLYTFVFLATYLLGFNPLGRNYSPLQAMFVPLVVGGSIAHFHYIQTGQTNLLEKAIFGLGVGFLSPILYLVFFGVFLDFHPDLVEAYLKEAMEFLIANKETFVRYSGEAEFLQTKETLALTGLREIMLDDLFKKFLIGFPFAVLFILLFFALPTYFRRPKINDNGK